MCVTGMFSGNKDILAEALYSTIMQLVEDVYTIPTSIVMFFKAAQRHVAQLGINTPHSTLGIKVSDVGVCVYVMVCVWVCVWGRSVLTPKTYMLAQLKYNTNAL